MLRSYHLCLGSSIHKNLRRPVAADYPGRCMPGVHRCRYKVLYGVIALSSYVSPYLALWAAIFSGSLVSL